MEQGAKPRNDEALLPPHQCAMSMLRLPATAFAQPSLPLLVLDRAARGRDDETFALLFDQFGNAGQADASRRGAVAQALRNYFMLGHSRAPSQADAARWLGMSRRSLVLRLAGEGTSYSEILDDHRRRYVLASLDEGMLCTKQIAHAVGFADENSLRRAFRKWTASSIRAWTGSRH
jgi:AraC-like DNA-binding protein